MVQTNNNRQANNGQKHRTTKEQTVMAAKPHRGVKMHKRRLINTITPATTTTTTKTPTNSHRKKYCIRGSHLRMQEQELLENIIPTYNATKAKTEEGVEKGTRAETSSTSHKSVKSPLSLSSLSRTPSTTIVRITKMNNHKRPRHITTLPLNLLLYVLMLMLVQVQTQNVTYAQDKISNSTAVVATTTTTAPTTSTTTTTKYSQPFVPEGNNEDSFRPIIPKDINLENISQNVFTKAGQYRVFEPVESDLRATVALKQNDKSTTIQTKKHSIENTRQQQQQQQQTIKQNQQQGSSSKVKIDFETQKLEKTISKHFRSKQIAHTDNKPSSLSSSSSSSSTTEMPLSNFQTEMSGLEGLLAEYVDNFFNKGQYQPKPQLIMALQQNYTDIKQKYDDNIGAHLPEVPSKIRPVRQAISKHADGELSLNIPRAFESGRLLFFAGLKKVMWPIYMGLQILKSLMFALLLPTLIGSFGKLLGKGLVSGSAPLFIRPMDEPQDLDFKDNNFNFEDDNNKFAMMDEAVTGGNVKDNGYAYNQAEASQTHNQYAYNAASINQQALSRYGMNERQQLMQDSYLSALQSLGAASFKNSNGLSGSLSGGGGGGGSGGSLAAPMQKKPAALANMNTFQQFQKVPASSLLLSNYDPFYSPLLSRLDSVFAQLKLNSDDEACREKLICLMYANPAKYAPYSNLVSAQLSRELNELRKPTSDNPDILRFFKYMRAAKDGQDGIDCEKSFDKCKEFKDFENPAMVSTYHDINKLVQARKFA